MTLLVLLSCRADCCVESAPTCSELFVDEDGDGWGGEAATSCADGLVEAGGDCDDGDADVHPQADESCDGFDWDCDGDVVLSTWYRDADEDTFGDPDDRVDGQCEPPQGYVPDDTDCDDGDDGVFPGAEEVAYDDVDQDCDGSDLIDVDGDGSLYTEDCDDEDPDRAPTLPEICDDGIDNDCNDEVDDDCQYFGGIVSRDAAAQIWGAYTMGQSVLSPRAGAQVLGVSDLDGDGADDFFVKGDDRNDDYHLFVGEVSGSIALADAAYSFEDDGRLSVSSAPGVVAVSSYWTHQDWYAGAVHLVGEFSGKHSPEDGFGAGVAIGSRQLDESFGYRAAIGDVDSDGELDVVANGTIGDWNGDGFAALFYGPFDADVEFIESTHPDVFSSEFEDSFLGDLMLVDADGDGLLDLFSVERSIPISGSSVPGKPGVRLFRGPLVPSAATDADVIATGPTSPSLTYQDWAWDPATAGSDYDGDGLPELTILLVNSDASTTEELRVLPASLPSEDLRETTATVLLEWRMEIGVVGPSFDVAGDVDGDGFDDLVVGEPAYDGNRGIAWLFFGPLTGTLTPDDAEGWLEGEHSSFETCEADTYACQHYGSTFGASVAGIGDNNGDGFDDLLIGAPYTETDPDDDQHGPGAAFLFHGGAR